MFSALTPESLYLLHPCSHRGTGWPILALTKRFLLSWGTRFNVVKLSIKHGKGKAKSILAHKLGRAIYSVIK